MKPFVAPVRQQFGIDTVLDYLLSLVNTSFRRKSGKPPVER
jgi:hypothetical protein